MASLEETQAEIRIKLAELAELFTSEVKVNFLAVHESNPNAHMLIGASSFEEIEEAIAALRE